MTGYILARALILAALILMSAYFSATETAFSSLNRTRVKTLAEKGDRRAELVCRLTDNYDKLLSTILIGNNIVNLSAASLGTVLFVKLYGSVGATISTVVLTVVVLIFGEITPKSVAKDSPEKFASFSAPFINLLIIIFTPINFIFSMWKKLVAKLFRTEASSKMSQDELLMMVEEVQQDGSIDHDEGELLRNAIEFDELRAEDILTHRVDLEAVDINDSKEDIARVFTESKFSRLLVYEDTIDHITGVIHLKDFFTKSGITQKPLSEIVTPAVFVLTTDRIDNILRRLQKAKSHIAVVVDEYGGTCGIVTMEDILEELVGEIWDEHDEEDEEFCQLDADTYLIDGSASMDDLCGLLDIEPDTDAVSAGGWAMEQLGRIPVEGDSFTFGNVEVQIMEMDHHRVSLIKTRLLPKPGAESGDRSRGL